ncbi:MAG: hypothetical protein JSS32_08010 [Verrucomicrobia bacterium]|nr:hypothetical protein [Verrucomicrobiota bacterium]
MDKFNKILTKYIEPIKRPLSASNKLSDEQTADSPAEMARLSIDLLAADHKRLKTAASLMGMSMKDLVVVSLGDFMYRKLNRVAKTTLTKSKNKKSSATQKNKRSS